MAIYKEGSTGEEVKTIQQQLKDAGFDPGGIDGRYGPNTAAAVKNFQTAAGITTDSIYGPETANAISTYKPVTAVTAPEQTVVQPVTQPITQPTTQPAIPEFTPPTDAGYTSPYNAQIDQALADYETWKKQPYVSQYADELESLVSQALTRQFNFDPSTDKSLQLAIKDMTRNVMESMNERGILNSTITADRTVQGANELEGTFYDKAYNRFVDEGNMLLSKVDMLMGIDDQQYGRYMDEGEKYAQSLEFLTQLDDRQFEMYKDARDTRYQQAKDKYESELNKYEAKRTSISDAWDRTSNLGYVDNDAAITLGVAPGTLSKEAREAKEAKQTWLEQTEVEQKNRLSEIDVQYNKESKLISARKEADTTTTDTAKMGTPEQVQSYYKLLGIYGSGNSEVYPGTIQDALNYLQYTGKQQMQNLLGTKLHAQLVNDLAAKAEIESAQKPDTTNTLTVDDYVKAIDNTYVSKVDGEVTVNYDGIKQYLDNLIMNGVDDTIIDSLAVRYNIQ